MVRATNERASERAKTRRREWDANAKDIHSFDVDVVVWKRGYYEWMCDGCARARGSVQSVASRDDLGLVSKRDRVDEGVDDGATMYQRWGMVKTLKRKV